MSSERKKITDLINIPGFTFSFELTPNISEDEINALEMSPVFFSVTWHAKAHQCKNLEIDPLQTVRLLKSKGKNVLLHLTCDMLRMSYLDQLLIFLKEQDICNLFVILGDNYNPDTSDFKSTTELIKYIREKTGDYFCIGIAGFPDCSDEKLLQLKQKLENGADFIVTQAFFEPEVLKKFIEQCENCGIKAPILPGVFLFENYDQLARFLNMCKGKVSDNFVNIIKSKEQSGAPCSEVIKKMVQDLKEQININHFHFFTMNKMQSVCNLIKQLG